MFSIAKKAAKRLLLKVDKNYCEAQYDIILSHHLKELTPLVSNWEPPETSTLGIIFADDWKRTKTWEKYSEELATTYVHGNDRRKLLALFSGAIINAFHAVTD